MVAHVRLQHGEGVGVLLLGLHHRTTRIPMAEHHTPAMQIPPRFHTGSQHRTGVLTNLPRRGVHLPGIDGYVVRHNLPRDCKRSGYTR